MEYSSGINKDELLPFTTTWMELEGISLSKLSKTEGEIETRHDFTPK